MTLYIFDKLLSSITKLLFLHYSCCIKQLAKRLSLKMEQSVVLENIESKEYGVHEQEDESNVGIDAKYESGDFFNGIITS